MLTLFMAISGGIDWDDVLLLKSTSMRIKVFFIEHVSSRPGHMHFGIPTSEHVCRNLCMIDHSGSRDCKASSQVLFKAPV